MRSRFRKGATDRPLPDLYRVFGPQPDWLVLDPSASPLEIYSHLVARPEQLAPTALGHHVEEILEQLGGRRLVAIPVREPLPAVASLLALTINAEKLAYHEAFEVVLAHATRVNSRPHCGARRHVSRHGPVVLEWELFTCNLDADSELSTWPDDSHLAVVSASLYPSRLPVEVELVWEITADATRISWDGFAAALAGADLPARLARLVGQLDVPRR